MNQWLVLSEGAFLFGPGGVNRIEPRYDYRDGAKIAIGCTLYVDTKELSIVDETLTAIVRALNEE